MVSHGVFSWGYVALAAVSLVVCLLMVLGLRLQDRAVMEPSRSYCASHNYNLCRQVDTNFMSTLTLPI